MMNDVTSMLHRLTTGDDKAVTELLPLVYDELRSLAARYVRAERAGHTLQATALVHEAYLRLVGGDDRNWANRTHFFATAATAMRRVLVDYARKRSRIKHGHGMERVSLGNPAASIEEDDQQLLALDEALTLLASVDPRKARVVELRFFAGLTVDEVATATQTSASSVARDWRMARAWLRSELESESQSGL